MGTILRPLGGPLGNLPEMDHGLPLCFAVHGTRLAVCCRVISMWKGLQSIGMSNLPLIQDLLSFTQYFTHIILPMLVVCSPTGYYVEHVL